MVESKFLSGAKALPSVDRRLLLVVFALAVLMLGLGVIYAAITAAARTQLFGIETETAYRALGLHGVTIFFYWLYFAQAGLVLLLATVYTENVEGIVWRPLAWLGVAAMVAGFVSSEASELSSATVLLYNGSVTLLIDAPEEGRLFYLGYLLLSAGLAAVAVSAIATALRPRLRGLIAEWSPVSFATVAWGGLLIVAAAASVNAFLPPLLWTMGLGAPVMDYSMRWSVLFHNMHYLPLMATVVLWYVLMESLTGAKSVFGPRFSKIVFSLYLIFVPPTSLYHMFLEPGLPEAVKVIGSILSLFIAVPTIVVFVVIVASLEAHARAHGGRGLFGWIAMLPWRHPSMAAIGMGVVNLAIGGMFSLVLIQEKLAVLLSDTFFVPAYFHFFTVGTVSLTFIAMLIHVLPALTGHLCWRPRLLARLPYILTIGLLLFGAGGIMAGYHGLPRRMVDLAFHLDQPLEHIDAPYVWGLLMGVVAAGALLMVATLAVYVYGLARMLLSESRTSGVEVAALDRVDWAGAATSGQGAWVGPLSVLTLVAGMYLFTSISFEILQSVPIAFEAAGH